MFGAAEAHLILPLCIAGSIVCWPRHGWTPRQRRPLRVPAWARPAGSGGALAAAVVALGYAWWAAAVLGLAGGLATVAVARRRPRPGGADSARVAGIVDMIGAGLASGLPPDRAITSVLDAVRSCVPDEAGPVDPRSGSHGRVRTGGGIGRSGRAAQGRAETPALAALAEAAALLALGTDPAHAWRRAGGCEEISALASAAGRSAVGGTRLADAARTTAVEIRQRGRRREREKASRVGVLLAAPLTLCFLPGFVCVGLVPVMISLVGHLGMW